MEIDREVVETVADLAKLKLDDPDVEAVIRRMTRILDLVEEMQALDTDGVEPLAHPLEAVQRLRPDEVTETDQRERYQSVAPETQAGLYLVPRVVE